MVSFASAFPKEQVKQLILSKFKVGCVIHTEVIFPHITKPKYLVLVADNDPECLTFLINSETNSFILNKPHLAQCQVNIDAANHSFLSYDSKIACHEVLKLKRSDVIKELEQDINKIQGYISDDVLSNILSAVKFAKTLSPQEKTNIISALSKSTN